MSESYILYNPLAGNGRCENAARQLKKTFLPGARLQSMVEIKSYAEFFAGLPQEATLVICGGDGTLNRFVNDINGELPRNKLLYYPAGSGNDFAHDVGYQKGDRPFEVAPYLKDLPFVEVNGLKRRFMNGIGYGIDGYCCEVVDELRKRSDKPVNYGAIAVKGLFFYYHPTNATVTVDGESHAFKNMWLAPTMNGRFYGGGIMPTPAQDRLNQERSLSVMAIYGAGRLKTLMRFPSVFKGEHVKFTDMVQIFKGMDITVRFERPTALQIDGETVLGVTEYRAYSCRVNAAQADEEKETTRSKAETKEPSAV